jgi:mitochondrial fission protein ELM1
MYEIQITFKDKDSSTITYNQYEYAGNNPELDGLERAKDILNNYFDNVDFVEVEVFQQGAPVFCNEYKKELLKKDKFYFIIKNIVNRQQGNEDHSDSGIVTAIKKELEKVRCEYE